MQIFLYLVNCRIIKLPTVCSGDIDFTKGRGRSPRPLAFGMVKSMSTSLTVGNNIVLFHTVLKKLLKSWFHEIFFQWERISRFSTVCSIHVDIRWYFVNIRFTWNWTFTGESTWDVRTTVNLPWLAHLPDIGLKFAHLGVKGQIKVDRESSSFQGRPRCNRWSSSHFATLVHGQLVRVFIAGTRMIDRKLKCL